MKEKIDKIIDDLINQRALTIPVCCYVAFRRKTTRI